MSKILTVIFNYYIVSTMLVIKIYINDKEVDDIHIQNIGFFDNWRAVDPYAKKKDLYMYKIRKPSGFEDELIIHSRSKGHRILAAKAMQLIKHKRSKHQ